MIMLGLVKDSKNECPVNVRENMFASVESIASRMPPLMPKYQLPAITGMRPSDAIPSPARAWNIAKAATYITYTTATLMYGETLFC